MEDKGHPARPEQPEHGFEEGQGHRDETERPRYSKGQEKAGRTPEKKASPRFSRGQEDEEATPEKTNEGRFSEGQEQPDER